MFITRRYAPGQVHAPISDVGFVSRTAFADRSLTVDSANDEGAKEKYSAPSPLHLHPLTVFDGTFVLREAVLWLVSLASYVDAIGDKGEA